MSPEPGPVVPTPAVPTIPYGASVPDNIDVNAIVTAVKSQGVYGPAEQVPALEAVVADAAMLKGRRTGNVVIAAAREPVEATAALTRALLSDPLPAQVLDGDRARAFAGGAAVLRDPQIV